MKGSQMIAVKTCTKCETVKPVTEFAKDASRGDNCQRHCKDCERAYKSERRERASELNKAWYIANKEAKQEYNRAAYLRRKESRV